LEVTVASATTWPASWTVRCWELLDTEDLPGSELYDGHGWLLSSRGFILHVVPQNVYR